MRFTYTKISEPQCPQHVLPLPCNACVSVMSERRQSDGVMVSNNHCSMCYCLHITFDIVITGDEIYAET